MKIISFIVFFAVVAATLADCGCLKCGKNLRVVSKPYAPVTVIYRGETCHCPKPIPYKIEVPTQEIYQNQPLRSYHYNVHQMRVPKPVAEPVLYRHGYRIEVPHLESNQPRYFVNLVAKTDRMVLPAPQMGCELPKPCSSGPMVEYLRKNDDCEPKRINEENWFFRDTKEDRKQFEEGEKICDKSRIKYDFEYDQKRQKAARNSEKDIESKSNPKKLSKTPSFNAKDQTEIKNFDSFSPDEVSWKYGKTRNGIFEVPQKIAGDLSRSKRNSLPFYQVSSKSNQDQKNKNYLKSFDVQSILPKNQLYYFINFPIRALDNFRKIKNHVSPIFNSVPKVLGTSKDYLMHLSKRFRKNSLGFLGKCFNLFKENERKRSKRAILKLVNPEDVRDFIKNNLGEIDDVTESSEENFLTPITPDDDVSEQNEGELFLEKLTPKLIKKNFVKPLRIKKSFKNEKSDTIKEEIDDLIEEISKNSIKKEDFENQKIPMEIIKEKIKTTLNYIQILIQIDFKPNEMIYEDLLNLENLKKIIVNEWKIILEKQKFSEINTKINLLNKMQEFLIKKEEIVEKISKHLLHEKFNSKNLIKILIKLQKLQCILKKSVENFSETIKYSTPINISNEFNNLKLLDQIDLIKSENHVDLCAELRKERDHQMEKEVDLLDNLKGLIECEICENKSKKIDQVSKLIWEINHIGKIQNETFLDLYDKINWGMKIRKELKIIFDLEKYLDECCGKLKKIFEEIRNERNVLTTTEMNLIETTTTKKLFKKRFSLKELLKKKN